MITFNSDFQTELLENDAANGDESFIAVKYDEAVGEPTAKVEQLDNIKADDDNLEKAIELNMNEDERDEIITDSWETRSE